MLKASTVVYIKKDWTEVHWRIFPKGIVLDSSRLGLRVKEGGGCEVGGVDGGRVGVCETG